MNSSIWGGRGGNVQKIIQNKSIIKIQGIIIAIATIIILDCIPQVKNRSYAEEPSNTCLTITVTVVGVAVMNDRR